jgi:hypothetical protein
MRSLLETENREGEREGQVQNGAPSTKFKLAKFGARKRPGF